MRPLTPRQSLAAGLTAVALVVLLQAFNSFACYRHSFGKYLFVLCTFIAIPMLPALVALGTKHPVRAVGGALLFAPWLVLAYYIDCIKPYAGGGAS